MNQTSIFDFEKKPKSLVPRKYTLNSDSSTGTSLLEMGKANILSNQNDLCEKLALTGDKSLFDESGNSKFLNFIGKNYQSNVQRSLTGKEKATAIKLQYLLGKKKHALEIHNQSV